MSWLYNWIPSLFSGWYASPARNAPSGDISVIKKMIETKAIRPISLTEVRSRLEGLKSISLDKVIESQMTKVSPFEVMIQARRNTLKTVEYNPFANMIKTRKYTLRKVPSEELIRPVFKAEADQLEKDTENRRSENGKEDRKEKGKNENRSENGKDELSFNV